MQKFAPSNASPPVPPGEHWPSDEELAAYIDGALGKAESKRMEAHLAACEDCYAVYIGAVKFQLESEPAPATVAHNVVPFPSREQVRDLWRWAAAAAGLLIVVGGGGGYYLAGPLPALLTSEVTAPLQGKASLTGGLWLGPTFRGSGDEGGEAPLDPASFQMGVQ